MARHIDVRSINRQKPDQIVTYSESFDSVLDGCYLRSETSKKSDGGQSMSTFWFDRFTMTYHFVYFDASGFAVELPPPTCTKTLKLCNGKAVASRRRRIRRI